MSEPVKEAVNKLFHPIHAQLWHLLRFEEEQSHGKRLP